jgi:hypothetical protein
MKKLIYFIISFHLVLNFLNCGGSPEESSEEWFELQFNESEYKVILYHYIERANYIPDADQYFYKISLSIGKLHDKISLRKKWVNALQYSVSGFAGLSTAILTANSNEPTKTKNTVGIVTAGITLTTSIVVIFITPNESDVSCISEWEKIKTFWEEAGDDNSLKLKAQKKAITFGLEHGLIDSRELFDKLK